MSSARPTYVYVTNSTEPERKLLQQLVARAFRGLPYPSSGARVRLGETAQIIIKRSSHLYIFDDAAMTKFEMPLDSKATESGAEKAAGSLILMLNQLFNKAHPKLPPFLWQRITPKRIGEAPSPARLVTDARPDHWFFAFELVMPTPDGMTNGVQGAVLEMRLRPDGNKGWRLIMLHIRFPLLGHRIEASSIFLKSRLLKDQDAQPVKAKPDPSKSLVMPKAILGSLTLPIDGPEIPFITPHDALPEAPQKPLPVMPLHAFMLPVEGSNLLAPFLVLGEGDGRQFAPATTESARLMIHQQQQGSITILTALVMPATHSDWSFVWYHAGLNANRAQAGNDAIGVGNTLIIPEGLHEIDVVGTRYYEIEIQGVKSLMPVVLRCRRMISSTMMWIEVERDQAQQLITHHGEPHGDAPDAAPSAHDHHAS